MREVRCSRVESDLYSEANKNEQQAAEVSIKKNTIKISSTLTLKLAWIGSTRDQAAVVGVRL